MTDIEADFDRSFDLRPDIDGAETALLVRFVFVVVLIVFIVAPLLEPPVAPTVLKRQMLDDASNLAAIPAAAMPDRDSATECV